MFQRTESKTRRSSRQPRRLLLVSSRLAMSVLALRAPQQLLGRCPPWQRPQLLLSRCPLRQDRRASTPTQLRECRHRLLSAMLTVTTLPPTIKSGRIMQAFSRRIQYRTTPMRGGSSCVMPPHAACFPEATIHGRKLDQSHLRPGGRSCNSMVLCTCCAEFYLCASSSFSGICVPCCGWRSAAHFPPDQQRT